jgi:hypothetical protein
VSDIAIYAEGGGNTAQQRAELRIGFDGLLRRFKEKAGNKKASLRIIPCGTRNATYEAFVHASTTDSDTTHVLLVDSEELVSPCQPTGEKDAPIRCSHLHKREAWDFSGVNPQTVHLMAQCMEAWIVADPDAVQSWYGQQFLPNALPTRINLEEEPKADVHSKLTKATHGTKKGPYRKIAHASKLLEIIDPAKVERRCPRFAKFTDWLDKAIDN